MNRRLTSVIASLHCAPTERAVDALRSSGVDASAIELTGNTIVDALQHILQSSALASAPMPAGLDPQLRLVVATVHRRENWSRLPGICAAIRAIVAARQDTQVGVTVHPNPAVRDTLSRELADTRRVVLLPAPDYVGFIKLLASSAVVLTDSGGVQEEAPVLGTPVLVMRDETERPEAVEAGVARLVGTSPDVIVSAALTLLGDAEAHAAMARRVSPFGDGHAAERIADGIERRRAQWC